MIRPTIYQGPGPVPRRVFAEDEWGKAEVSGGTAEDDPVLGTTRLQREEQRLVEGCPLKKMRVEWDPRGGTTRNWFRVNTSPPH